LRLDLHILARSQFKLAPKAFWNGDLTTHAKLDYGRTILSVMRLNIHIIVLYGFANKSQLLKSYFDLLIRIQCRVEDEIVADDLDARVTGSEHPVGGDFGRPADRVAFTAGLFLPV